MMAHGHSGGCLCGAVTFQVSGKISELTFCHCSACRKQTGLYYATVSAKTDALTIEGEDFLNCYQDNNGASRSFCKICGSALFWKSAKAKNKPYIEIIAGAFDSAVWPEDGHHIYCADKGDFYEISDDFPQYDQSKVE